jgi:hypothetical protein
LSRINILLRDAHQVIFALKQRSDGGLTRLAASGGLSYALKGGAPIFRFRYIYQHLFKGIS